MKRFMNKKVAVVAIAVALVIGIGGAAFAIFSTTGTGTGSAQVGTPANVTISQIGPGYDSLASTYHQDQCLECTNLTEFGNEINLSTTGVLSNVVVAFRSYAGGTSSEPITLTLYTPNGSGGVTGPISDYSSVTTDPTIPSGNGSTVFYVTFDFSAIDLTLSGPVVYGISYTDEAGVTINIALSNSVSNLTVGSDVYPGDVFVDGATNALSASGDAGSCATSTAGVFAATDINCATPPDNYGAYGPGSNPNNADIPAVEFNVVGGSTPPLYPGDTQPFGFAITNANSGSVYVNQVTIALETYGTDAATQADADINGCLAAWFTINGSPVNVAQNIPIGTTQFEGAASITMNNVPAIQNACAGAIVGLSFSSN